LKDKESLHKRVQEQFDCFGTTNPLKEMSELVKEKDTEEAALKWLALAALHKTIAYAMKCNRDWKFQI
jgi:hypothetical protein